MMTCAEKTDLLLNAPRIVSNALNRGLCHLPVASAVSAERPVGRPKKYNGKICIAFEKFLEGRAANFTIWDAMDSIESSIYRAPSTVAVQNLIRFAHKAGLIEQVGFKSLPYYGKGHGTMIWKKKMSGPPPEALRRAGERSTANSSPLTVNG